MSRIRMTESLDLDLANEMWHCNRCGHALVSARENYKTGCLIYNRDPREIHQPLIEVSSPSRRTRRGFASSSSTAPSAARRSKRNTCRPATR